MEMGTKNSSGMMNGLPPIKKDDKKVGPIVGALVVVLIIIILTLYFFGKRLNTQNPVMIQEQFATTTIETTGVSTSDDDGVESIEKELSEQLQDTDVSF